MVNIPTRALYLAVVIVWDVGPDNPWPGTVKTNAPVLGT